MDIKVNRTHIALLVTDPDASALWYADILGMEQVARNNGDWIMMGFGEKHHDIALIKAPEGAGRGTLGLQHYGLEIDGDETTLRKLYGLLLSKQVDIVNCHTSLFKRMFRRWHRCGEHPDRIIGAHRYMVDTGARFQAVVFDSLLRSHKHCRRSITILT